MTSLPVPDLPGLVDVAPLGSGGFADVHLGRQVHLERWVAAKVFRVTLADRAAADRFRAECRSLGRLDQYPHVITVHDAGVLPDGRPYLISERCDGSLADLVGGPPSVDRVVEIGLTMARALLFAHSHDVLHGDVTPRNVRLRASGAPVLADFGMAVLRAHRGPAADGYTAAHAAPETVLYGTVDEAVDVFGLGSTLWTALAGSPPFPSRGSVRLARIECGPPDLPTAVPSWLADVLAGMLSPDAADRPSMGDVVAAFAAGVGGSTASTAGRADGPAAGGTEQPASDRAVPPVRGGTRPAAANPAASVPEPRRPVPGRPVVAGSGGPMDPVTPPPAAATPSGPGGPVPRPRPARSVVPWLVVAVAAALWAFLVAWWWFVGSAPVVPSTPMSSVSTTAPSPPPPVAIDPPVR